MPSMICLTICEIEGHCQIGRLEFAMKEILSHPRRVIHVTVKGL